MATVPVFTLFELIWVYLQAFGSTSIRPDHLVFRGLCVIFYGRSTRRGKRKLAKCLFALNPSSPSLLILYQVCIHSSLNL